MNGLTNAQRSFALYSHHITFAYANTYITIIDNEPTPFTRIALNQWLAQRGYTNTNNLYPAGGLYKSGDRILRIFGIHAYSTSATPILAFNPTGGVTTINSGAAPIDTVGVIS